MLAAKLNSCTWTRVTTWVNMRCSNPGDEYLENQYSESDFDNYVELLFRDVAEKMKVNYNEVKDILYGRNTSFFEEKARYFSDYGYMGVREEEFESLTSKLLLPSMFEIEKKSSVQVFLESFDQLELKDKVEILTRLSRAKLELGLLEFELGPANNIKNSIEGLSEQSKYQLVKSVLEAEVAIDIELK